MNFTNPEFNFKNKIRKVKTQNIHNPNNGVHKWYFQTTLFIFEVDNPWKRLKSSNLDRCFSN
jgi:hypothetical protein